MSALQRRTSRTTGQDDGAALVSVLGIALVVAIVSTSLASMVLANTGTTADVRSAVRAQAAADAGLDVVLSELHDVSYGQLPTVCSRTVDVDGLAVAVTTSYRLSTGATVSCPTTAQATQVAQLVVSASASDRANLGREAVARTATVELQPTPPQASLDHAIFGESSLEITNDSEVHESAPGLHDAHIYTNGALECKTQAGIEGQVYAAQGDIVLWDNCDIASTVWARGKVTMKSNSSVEGDLYAASDAAEWGVLLENSSAEVHGNVLTNGGVKILGSSNKTQGSVRGSVFARTGALMLQQGAVIGGSGYAQHTIRLEDGAEIKKDALTRAGSITVQNSNNKIGGYAKAGGTIAPSNLTVGGAKQAGVAGLSFPSVPNPSTVFPAAVGFPTQIQPPVREQFPRILEQKADLALWQAAGWDVLVFTNVCAQGTVMDHIKANRPTKTMLVFEGCTSPIKLDNAAITLNTDRAIVSTAGFTSQNNLNFSVQGNGSQNLYLIVPAYAPGVTWTTLPSGQTTPSCTSGLHSEVDRLKPKDVKVIIYTPCSFTWKNTHPNDEQYEGQIYAGTLKLPPNFDLKIAKVPVPGLSDGTPNPSAPAEMQLQARYDVPS